jgi:crossover junction endodeoxyribonuclease RuvC
MKVLGVDPGLRVSGYAVITSQSGKLQVVDAGTIRVDEKLSLAQRLQQIYFDADALLLEQEPDVMGVEELYSHYKHPRTAILMGHARSMFLLAAAQRGIEVRDFSATRIKKSLTGSGRAGKEQMQRAVQTQLQLAEIPASADVADALAIAMCCFTEMSKPKLKV